MHTIGRSATEATSSRGNSDSSLLKAAASVEQSGALGAALHGNTHVGDVWQQTEQWVTFAYLVTALMFARLDLYAERPRRQGLAKVAVGLSQAAVVSQSASTNPTREPKCW